MGFDYLFVSIYLHVSLEVEEIDSLPIGPIER